uniref:C-type lectin domain-containing protein n=1 Tax=Neogobius melanostomus TaxID=47308 RepID=A0A8C6UM69_9GOBI
MHILSFVALVCLVLLFIWPGQFGAVRDYVWFDIASSQLHTFLCYKVHAIRKRMTWDDALQYCRTYHRDLASVASETEMMLIEKELGKEFSKLTWIGLMRNRTDQTKWMWSGGSEVTECFWAPGEPNEIDTEKVGAVRDYVWFDIASSQLHTFLFLMSEYKKDEPSPQLGFLGLKSRKV